MGERREHLLGRVGERIGTLEELCDHEDEGVVRGARHAQPRPEAHVVLSLVDQFEWGHRCVERDRRVDVVDSERDVGPARLAGVDVVGGILHVGLRGREVDSSLRSDGLTRCAGGVASPARSSDAVFAVLRYHWSGGRTIGPN